MRLLCVLLLFVHGASGLKFLAYSPQFATSHMHFMGRLSDALVNAGHEVVMLAPILDRTVDGPGTAKARVITLPQAALGVVFEQFMHETLPQKVWTYESAAEIFEGWDEMVLSWVAMCNATVHHPGLLEALRAERFDAAFGETMDPCMPGLLHLLSIDKWAITESLLNDGHFRYSHTPTNPAYVPGLMYAEGGEAMSFMQRLKNTAMIQLSNWGRMSFDHLFDEVFAAVDPAFPGSVELCGLNSLFFVNTDPLVDFPRPASARMVDIGGVAVAAAAPDALNKTWSDILDLRPATVLISFGSMARSHLMPAQYKTNLLKTLRAFPNVTFIWKYEKPEHRISAGVANLIETTWAPQHAILNDPRLSAFVTHCGQGSTTEANYAGVPLVVVPTAFDQMRNAEAMRRLGLGIVLERRDLGGGRFGEALSDVLQDLSYKERALQLRATLLDRPFPMKEVFVRHMAFLAAHGPLRQLDHHGRHLSFAQYYLLDVIAAGLAIALLLTLALFLIVRTLLRSVLAKFKKEKSE